MPDLRLIPYDVNILISGDYLATAVLRPLGDLLVFLNDQNRSVFSVEQAHLYPLAPESQVPVIQQNRMAVTKDQVMAVTIADKETAARVQLISASRRIVIYTSQFAIRGMLHVNQDAPDEDLLDDSRDFFGMTDAVIFPLAPVARQPLSPVALAAFNRRHVQAYHRSA